MDDAARSIAMAHDIEHADTSQGARITAGTFCCCCCDKPITGRAVRVEGFSASGARPDDWRHDSCYVRRR